MCTKSELEFIFCAFLSNNLLFVDKLNAQFLCQYGSIVQISIISDIMASSKDFLRIAELALGEDKEGLIAYLKTVAGAEINKNRHGLYGGLMKLVETHSGSNRYIQSSYNSGSWEAGYLPEHVWLPARVRVQVESFIEFYKGRTLVKTGGLNHMNKVLLYGPPGTGKTTLGFYIAKLINKNIKYVKISDVVSSKFGETLKNISDIFTGSKEEVLFIDEFDAFGKSRNDDNDVGELKRIVNSIIQTLDFNAGNKVVIVSTNLIDSIDPAILRRFPFKILVDALHEDEKQEFFEFIIKNHPEIQINLKSEAAAALLGLLELRTIDEIKTFFEKTLVTSHVRKSGVIQLSDFLEIALADGSLSKERVRRMKKEQPERLSFFGRRLEAAGYPKTKIAEFLGIHRNSYDSYIG